DCLSTDERAILVRMLAAAAFARAYAMTSCAERNDQHSSSPIGSPALCRTPDATASLHTAKGDVCGREAVASRSSAGRSPAHAGDGRVGRSVTARADR